MGDKTAIAWTDKTFNPVIGCEGISPGCDNCYAAAYAKRVGRDFDERTRTGEDNWKQPLKWDREAAAAGKRFRVFCASLADVFDNKWPAGVREDLWKLIEATPNLDWQILTKRIGNVAAMVPEHWQRDGWPENVQLGITVVNQQEFDRDVGKLVAIPAKRRFLSVEPQLGPLSIDFNANAPGQQMLRWYKPLKNYIHWVINGGESGPGARVFHTEWAMDLLVQCREAKVPFFFKQHGSNAMGYGDSVGFPSQRMYFPLKFKNRAGADPAEWHNTFFKKQEFPT